MAASKDLREKVIFDHRISLQKGKLLMRKSVVIICTKSLFAVYILA